MGFGDFLKGAAESVGKKIDDAAEGAGEAVSDVTNRVGLPKSRGELQDAAGGFVGEALKVPYRPGGTLAGDLGEVKRFTEPVADAVDSFGRKIAILDDKPSDEYGHALSQDLFDTEKSDQGWMDFILSGPRSPSDSLGDLSDEQIDTANKGIQEQRDYWLSDAGRAQAETAAGVVNSNLDKYGLDRRVKPHELAIMGMGEHAQEHGASPLNPALFEGSLGDVIRSKGEGAETFSTFLEGTSEASETIIKEPSNPASWALAGEVTKQAIQDIPTSAAIAATTYGAIKTGPFLNRRLGNPVQPHSGSVPRPAGGMSQFEELVRPRVGFSYKPEGWRQTGANRAGAAVESFAGRAGLPRGIGEFLGRSTTRALEPTSVPPGARPGSRADANPGRFGQLGRDLYNTSRVTGLIQSGRTANDLYNYSSNPLVQDAVDLYDPDKGVEAIRDFKDWRSGDATTSELADKYRDQYNLPEFGESADIIDAIPDKYVYGAGALAAGGMLASGLAGAGAAGAASSLLRGGNPVQAVQQAAAQQTSGESQGYSPMYKQSQEAPSGTSLTMPRMDSFGAGTTAKPGKAARPAAVSGDYSYREPSVQNPLGSGTAQGSQGPSKSPLYAGINQPGPRMQPGERKRGGSFVSGSVHGEKGATMSGTLGWNAQTKGSYIFPELTQPPNTKKPREVLGV